MKNKVGLLLSLSAILVLVGVGCASKAPVVQDAQNTDSLQPDFITQPITETKTETETQPSTDTQTKPTPEVQTEVKTEIEVAPGKSKLTMAEVAKHNAQTDCYIVVRDSVYDVTKFIPNHPGGPQRIIPLCGTDATAAFTGQHGGQPQPEAALASFKIGALQK